MEWGHIVQPLPEKEFFLNYAESSVFECLDWEFTDTVDSHAG